MKKVKKQLQFIARHGNISFALIAALHPESERGEHP
jgi:hypothetical protein